MNLIEYNESNGTNDYYVVDKYVVMHIVKGKFAIYDYEFHAKVLDFCPFYPNDGYACMMIKQKHLDLYPEMNLQLNTLLYMHVLLMNLDGRSETNETDKIIHHINERRRDNRRENMIWMSKNVSIALCKKFGKANKPPMETRHICAELPPFCHWINAKKAFWIDCHPACFLAVNNREQKHKYIESIRGKKWTVEQKLTDILSKYDKLLMKPFGNQSSFHNYMNLLNTLATSHNDIIQFVQNCIIRNYVAQNCVNSL
jgi:hypothetical protein